MWRRIVVFSIQWLVVSIRENFEISSKLVISQGHCNDKKVSPVILDRPATKLCNCTRTRAVHALCKLRAYLLNINDDDDDDDDDDEEDEEDDRRE